MTLLEWFAVFLTIGMGIWLFTFLYLTAHPTRHPMTRTETFWLTATFLLILIAGTLTIVMAP